MESRLCTTQVKALASVAWDALSFSGHSTSVEALRLISPIFSIG
jgi:hypothetical protein